MHMTMKSFKKQAMFVYTNSIIMEFIHSVQEKQMDNKLNTTRLEKMWQQNLYTGL